MNMIFFSVCDSILMFIQSHSFVCVAVYLISGVGAFVLVVSITVICVAGCGQNNNK